MSKKIALLQSNYIPWKGYFDLINSVDEFILFDDMQYTRRDWRNRNKIKTPNGPAWLSIPIQVKGKYFQPIKDAKISDPGWNVRHWKTIQTHYAKARFFSDYKEAFANQYLECREIYLSQINYRFLAFICEILGIKTKISWSMDFQLVDGATERLIDICKQTDADAYLSGPNAKNYLKEDLFAAENIALEYFSYDDYSTYPQLHPPFVHAVSIIDLIFNAGENASSYMKSFQK